MKTTPMRRPFVYRHLRFYTYTDQATQQNLIIGSGPINQQACSPYVDEIFQVIA